MKNLKLISFVGIDEQTNLDEITFPNFKKTIPYDVPCEWSVLYSDSKSTGNYVRYPSYDFCKKFLTSWNRKTDNKPFCSLHLCGSVIERYLNKEKDVMDLCDNAFRIQLNLNIKEYPDHLKLTERIQSVLKQYGHKIILQQNKTKEKFMKVFLENNTFHINILHDGSGGFGREISKILPPDDKYVTGYAGGINPNNVAKIVKMIESVNQNNRPYYIDMESGIRENNIFSIEKCKEVINNLL